MKYTTLIDATNKARRFSAIAAELIYENKGEDKNISGTKTSAACRRASMELTRVLADLRQGR